MEEATKDILEETSTDTSETLEVSTADEGKTKRSKPLNKKFIIVLILAVAFILLYADYRKEVSGSVKNANETSENSVAAASPAGVPQESFLDYLGGKFSSLLQGKKNGSGNSSGSLTVQEAEDFVNTNLMQDGTGATVSEVTEENGLFKIKLSVSGQEYTAYLTKDKQLFFPQAINIAEIQKQKADDAAASQAEEEKQLTEMTKNDKPVVELFVMSHCPYGTQIEKGIIPVVKALGDKIDFKLKFCDYAMHEKKELDEEMNQYCISQNQPDKLISYLECFLADETSSAKCVAQVGIDSTKLASCVAATDSQYKITAGYNDKATWKSETYPSFPIFQADVTKYSISGSPSLVINGKTVSTGRDSATLLKFVCAGFTNAPEACKETLSSTAPSAGFGYAEGTTTGDSGSCN